MSWNEKIKHELGGCGENVYIGYNTIFTNPKQVFLDDRVRIDPFCLITTQLKVGSNSHICSHAVLGGGSMHKITMDGWNFIGYGSKLFCASEDYSGKYGPVCEFWGRNKIYHGDIHFFKYAGIASDVMVFPGAIFPEGCTIGAKSLVIKTGGLEGYSVYIGNPLKFHKYRDSKRINALAKSLEFLK